MGDGAWGEGEVSLYAFYSNLGGRSEEGTSEEPYRPYLSQQGHNFLFTLVCNTKESYRNVSLSMSMSCVKEMRTSHSRTLYLIKICIQSELRDNPLIPLLPAHD